MYGWFLHSRGIHLCRKTFSEFYFWVTKLIKCVKWNDAYITLLSMLWVLHSRYCLVFDTKMGFVNWHWWRIMIANIDCVYRCLEQSLPVISDCVSKEGRSSNGCDIHKNAVCGSSEFWTWMLFIRLLMLNILKTIFLKEGNQLVSLSL